MPGTALACGLATVDVVQVVDAVPGPDEKVRALSTTTAAGGPACNAAVTSALLGVRTTFVGAVGQGPLSSVVLRDLGAAGVAVEDLVGPAYEPAVATAVVTRSTGERAVVSGRPPVAPVVDGLHSGRLAALLDGVGALLVDGHLLEAAVPLARAARAAGVAVLLDGGSWKPGLEDLLPVVDVAVVSAAFRLPDDAGLAGLLGAGPTFVAASDGAGPVRWRTASGARGEVLVPVVDVVDTPGAGDVLHGALLAGVARHGTGDLPGLLAEAVTVASRSVTAEGAHGWASV